MTTCGKAAARTTSNRHYLIPGYNTIIRIAVFGHKRACKGRAAFTFRRVVFEYNIMSYVYVTCVGNKMSVYNSLNNIGPTTKASQHLKHVRVVEEKTQLFECP